MLFCALSSLAVSLQDLKIVGSGPPVVVSTGLFNTVPSLFYSDMMKQMQKKMTLVRSEMAGPIRKTDIDLIADFLRVDRVGFFSHSSFDRLVLESPRLHRAVVCDPICLPSLRRMDRRVTAACPVLEVRARRLYSGTIPLPQFNRIVVDGDVTRLECNAAGHTDIMDDAWADAANVIGLWDAMVEERFTYHNYKYVERRRIPRREYRAELTEQIVNFLMQPHFATEVGT